MITCTNFEKDTNCADFYIDTVQELSDLPNLTNKGKNNLEYMSPVIAGSTAICKNGKVYILDGTNNWVELGA